MKYGKKFMSMALIFFVIFSTNAPILQQPNFKFLQEMPTFLHSYLHGHHN